MEGVLQGLIAMNIKYFTQQLQGVWRVLDKNTNEIALDTNGSYLDGGGHTTQERALLHTQHLNKGASCPALDQESVMKK